MTRKSIPILTAALVAIPSVAFAADSAALLAASNGPWIVLAVVGVVRAALCLGSNPLEVEPPAL